MADNRTASDLADVDRASNAGEQDGRNGTHDPDGKLQNDTPEQREAYERSYEHGRSER
jgi:hypothetical protein